MTPGYRVTADLYIDMFSSAEIAARVARDALDAAMMEAGGTIYAYRITGTVPHDLETLSSVSDDEGEGLS